MNNKVFELDSRLNGLTPDDITKEFVEKNLTEEERQAGYNRRKEVDTYINIPAQCFSYEQVEELIGTLQDLPKEGFKSITTEGHHGTPYLKCTYIRDSGKDAVEIFQDVWKRDLQIASRMESQSNGSAVDNLASMIDEWVSQQ